MKTFKEIVEGLTKAYGNLDRRQCEMVRFVYIELTTPEVKLVQAEPAPLFEAVDNQNR
jgi:hypothetical protein